MDVIFIGIIVAVFILGYGVGRRSQRKSIKESQCSE
jgi:hypothetical protein